MTITVSTAAAAIITVIIENLSKTRKQLETKLYNRKSHRRNKQLGYSSYKILKTILEVNEERTSTNGRENKKTNDDA